MMKIPNSKRCTVFFTGSAKLAVEVKNTSDREFVLLGLELGICLGF